VGAAGRKGEFHLALSGGSTPEPLYTRLLIDPDARVMPWDRTHLWLVDERRVPASDARSNFRMIRETIVEHTPVRRRHVHRVPVEAPAPAEAYEAELRRVFGQPEAPPRLDFVLLGMGADGHTASLFPGSPALGERQRLVAENAGPAVTAPPRVTMTYPLLNEARILAVLVTGARKRAMLEAVTGAAAAGTADPARMPITGIAPTRGRLDWFIDEEAGG